MLLQSTGYAVTNSISEYNHHEAFRSLCHLQLLDLFVGCLYLTFHCGPSLLQNNYFIIGDVIFSCRCSQSCLSLAHWD